MTDKEFETYWKENRMTILDKTTSIAMRKRISKYTPAPTSFCLAYP